MNIHLFLFGIGLLARAFAMEDCKTEDEAVESDGGLPHATTEECRMKCYCAIEGSKSMYVINISIFLTKRLPQCSCRGKCFEDTAISASYYCACTE